MTARLCHDRNADDIEESREVPKIQVYVITSWKPDF
jgi:hypothetical protein